MTRRVARMMTDVVLIMYAFGACGILRTMLSAPFEMLQTLTYSLVPFVGIHIVALGFFDAYNFSRQRSESDLAFSAFMGSIAGTTLSFILSSTFLLYYAPNVHVVGRSVFLGGGLLCAVALPWWRVWLMRVWRRRGELDTRVIAFGSAASVQKVAAELTQYSRAGHHIVGCVVHGHCDVTTPGAEVLGTAEDLTTLIQQHDVHEILVVGDVLAQDHGELLRVLRACEEASVVAHVLPGYYEALVGRLDLYEIGGLPLIELKRHPLPWSYGVLKRASDFAISAAGLVAALPVIAVAAIAIKLDSPGPIFYTQVRTGRNGREFSIYKLRTMHTNAEDETGPVMASKQDPRVTRVGRFLRSKRIDEVPQLWNVLKGDMSLVGPRPERPFFIRRFSEEAPLFPLRLRVKPGITSLSHVWGRYDSSPSHRLLYDLVYMSNISLMLDLRILIDTIKIVLTGRGAQ
jgi:exopolysaccharide biosynthesis polyprenyl glycosylphosphotransferase